MKESPKTKVTIILPCYNEEAILQKNISVIIGYLKSKGDKYDWDILIVNDGSKDKTKEIAESLSLQIPQISVVNHPVNMNLGNAIKTGFCNAKGDILVVMDVDLSYAPEHIETMVDTLLVSYADMVVASPYMKGGKVTAVPFMRKIMSRFVNRFMSMASQDKYYTFTGMVRAYRKDFVAHLNLKTRDYEINPEIMYKAMILRARIVEIPAHLDWTEQNKMAGKRTSSIRVLRGVFSGVMSGFIFRPYIFFIGVGFILLLLSMYQLVWLLYDTLYFMTVTNSGDPSLTSSFSESLALQFTKNPHSFLTGGVALLAALQFLGLGFVSLQNKRYFEELFHLGTSVLKRRF